ncbi:hypothetical protein BOV88_07155 [Solemya velum gill symbiont]|uniref:Glycosyltransferase RgtA/B/C/D-like domain-containing protein n=1 Tax=Solemya velum gill symbiont TaxID=2340 RepID=A0A1T2DJT1_SOVGS|nr:hypothetical protein BOV88_07155 [Solemya velum gill symbiont]OOY42642.1 hypothetical protein BOV92_13130 [Solemya velum gill symbiont]OOY47303.1 hypothetical protein BOV93_07430 [Solemya velum gill symbiont]
MALYCVILATIWKLTACWCSPSSIWSTSVKNRDAVRWRNPALFIWIILLLAVAFQLPGIFHGLPYYLNIDETYRITTVLGMLQKETLNPEWFGHPAQTIIYSLWLLYQLVYILGSWTGYFDSITEFLVFLSQNPEYVLIPGRVLVFTATILVVYLTYRIGSLFNQYVGLFAAAVVAVSPLLVSQGSLIRNSDIVMALFALLALYFALKAMESSSARDYFLSGIGIGLATATKYPGVIAAILPVVAYVTTFRMNMSRIHLILISAIGSIFAAFMVGPYLFLDFDRTLSFISNEARSVHLSATSEGFFPDLVWLLDKLAFSGIGLACILLALFGLVSGLRTNPKKTALVASFPIVLLIFYAGLDLRWDRWIISMIPFSAILAGMGYWSISEKVSGYIKSGSSKSAFTFIFALILISHPAYASLKAFNNKIIPSTRVIAAKWITENVPQGSGFLVEMHGPQLSLSKYRFFEVFRNRKAIFVQQVRKGSQFSSNYIPNTRYGRFAGAPQKRLQQVLKNKRINYVVLTEFHERYIKEQARLGGQEPFLRIYERLFENSTKIYEIQPQDGILSGHHIKVLKLENETIR